MFYTAVTLGWITSALAIQPPGTAAILDAVRAQQPHGDRPLQQHVVTSPNLCRSTRTDDMLQSVPL
ncbi:hypothetical protein ACQP00_19790 [Dactylosporangium sp. CS-047395]|uniref:hypothetical protein n=1 Tax=Dactylosporangium sp. CS-047395 TaxID=3239936 RepID=UPI003D8F32E1